MEILILTLIVLSVTCEEKVNKNGTLDQNTDITKCDGTITDIQDRVITDIDAVCGPSTPCFTKCCGVDELLYLEKIGSDTVKHCLHKDTVKKKLEENRTVFDLEAILNYSDYNIWNKDEENVTTNKNLKSSFTIIVNKQLVNEDDVIFYLDSSLFKLFEDGTFVILTPKTHVKTRAMSATDYCIDKAVNPGILKTHSRGRYVHLIHFIKKSEGEIRSVFTGVAMIISAFFLLLVFLVYSLLKQLRNIQGMVLMAYVATLAIGYLLKAVLLLGVANNNMDDKMCQKLSPACYAFLLSSFLWLNIMSFDIWWTFRGFRKVRAIHRQGELMKFMWYGLYAWGLPALVASIAYYLHIYIDPLKHPEFIRPPFDTCFFDKVETLLYLHLPILITTVLNTLLFLMTFYNIWLINNGISNFDNSNRNTSRNNRHRFWIYIKISVLMGVSWILELLNQISKTSYPTWLFILLNIYNMFIGVAIFIIYVFKMSIFKMLCNRFNITRFNKQNVTSTKTSNYSRSEKSVTKNENVQTIDESKTLD